MSNNDSLIVREETSPEFYVDLEKIIRILKSNGVEAHFKTPEDQLDASAIDIGIHSIDTLAEELKDSLLKYDFSLPKEPMMYFFYKIGTMDFDAAYLYAPDLSSYFYLPVIDYEIVNKLSIELSREIKFPILAINEKGRFDFPKFRIFRNGTVSKVSAPGGKEPYDPDFSSKDTLELIKRVTNNPRRYEDLHNRMLSNIKK
ncbi:hypothetical protein HQ533_03245 [Candidatus Woesearchaeota archaeon]|nr:hypothetical protein [Candidatus Woesearchaeota archaeon]